MAQITDLTWQQLETASGTSLIIVDNSLGLLLRLSALTGVASLPTNPKDSAGVVQALYRLQDFKVEVFQPGNDTPTLVKQPNSPTYETAPGQLTVPNRDSGLGKPNNLPDRQNYLRNDGQYRTVDVTPNSTAKPAPSKQLNQLSNGTAGETAMAELAYYAGFLIDGFIDGTQNKNPYKQATKQVLTPVENLSYQTVNMAGKEARDLTQHAIKSAEKLLDDLWRNKPTFEIPQIKIPKFDKPELPDLEIPKFPEFKSP